MGSRIVTAVYRMDRESRLTLVGSYVGRRARIVLKDPYRPRTGYVVAVAEALILNTADLVIMQVDHP